MSLRVLFVGHFREHPFSGWRQAALDYLFALDSAGVEVAARPLLVGGSHGELPGRILELEARPVKNPDVVVFHALPQHYQFSGRIPLNVGLFATETTNFRNTAWADRANCMDRVWAINRASRQAMLDSGVSVPIDVVPHATDLARFETPWEPLPELKALKDRGYFLFYSAGEFSRRKNYAALLRAFHAEFEPSEPARLVLKVSKPGMNPDQTKRHVQEFCQKVRAGLKLPRTHWAEEVVLTEKMSAADVLRFHSSCDCFVSASRGEAWNQIAFDAMGMGKTPVHTAAQGVLDWLDDRSGWLVRGRHEPCFGADDTFADLYTADEDWFSADIKDLKRCMRQVYEDRQLREDKARRGRERAREFSHEKVGRLMRTLLEQALAAAPRRGRTVPADEAPDQKPGGVPESD